jgi:molybdopterin-guanine dinucleotide biosynthesis protein A
LTQASQNNIGRGVEPSQLFTRRPLLEFECQRQRIEEELLAERSITTRFVLDDSDFQGPLAGLYAACSNLGAPWLFLVGCDMPLVDAKAVSWLFDRPQISTADAIVPETDSGIEPLHALYRRESVRAIRDRVRTDDGLYVLFDVLDETRVVPVRDCPYDMDKSTQNVNTVEDLNTLEERWDDDSQ